MPWSAVPFTALVPAHVDHVIQFVLDYSGQSISISSVLVSHQYSYLISTRISLISFVAVIIPNTVPISDKATNNGDANGRDAYPPSD